jgi:hypothetical protein
VPDEKPRIVRVLDWVGVELILAWHTFSKTRWVVWVGIAVGVLLAISFPGWFGFLVLFWAFLPWKDAGLRPPHKLVQFLAKKRRKHSAVLTANSMTSNENNTRARQADMLHKYV